jgi:transglutaminase-like putative cysteine protease
MPQGISEHIDQECNNAATMWFDGQHRSLSVTAKSEVEVLPTNPFNYFVTENEFLYLPVTYSKSCQYQLQPYLSRRGKCSTIDDFVQPITEEAKGETLSFLLRLASSIHEQYDRVERETGSPMVPEETIAKREGTCRDLAVLFMESCRAVGLAARFVSGYRWCEDSDKEHNLHAWSEIYIPGGGWRGFDPIIGLAVTDQYIAVAAAANPVDVAPVSGTFRGTGASSRLEYDVSVSALF